MEIIKIVNKNYAASIKLSNRNKKGICHNLKKNIKRFLFALSGNDLIEMLKDDLG